MARAGRISAIVILAVAAVAALGGSAVARHGYDEQSREAISAPPSREFPLGTDELGRDRFARLLTALRVALVLAPAACAAAVAISAVAGGAAGFAGGRVDRTILAITDLFMTVPWLFVLLAVRSLVPLNASPESSLAATFALLACLGWVQSTRVVRAAARSAATSDYVLQARTAGLPPWRILRAHVLPNLRPVLAAQFWISLPLFIVSEANLGLLGLGAAEPLPSLGSMLREADSWTTIAAQPAVLAPAIALVLLLAALQSLCGGRATA